MEGQGKAVTRQWKAKGRPNLDRPWVVGRLASPGMEYGVEVASLVLHSAESAAASRPPAHGSCGSSSNGSDKAVEVQGNNNT